MTTFEKLVIPETLAAGPGPGNTDPRVLEAFASSGVADHMQAYVIRGMKEIKFMLREMFGTKNVYTYAIAGTGWCGLDAMQNAILPGDTVVAFNNGTFSGIDCQTIRMKASRPEDLAANPLMPEPANVHVFDIPHGTSVSGEMVESALADIKPMWAFMSHWETGSGRINDLRGFNDACAKHGAMGLIDAVSSLGAVEIRPEELGVDLVIASTQHALGLPPGASIAWMSDRAYRRAMDREHRGFSLDPARWIEAAHADAVPSTPPIAHFFGLQASLEAIREEGMVERGARHRRIAARIREWAGGYGVLADEPFRSPTVTVVQKPDGFAYPKFAKALRKRGFAVADGYGRLRDRTFRIGHMGYVTDDDAASLIEALDAV